MKKRFCLYLLCFLSVFTLCGLFVFNFVDLGKLDDQNSNVVVTPLKGENMTLTKKRLANSGDSLEVITVVATINPDIAIEKTVDWEIKWANTTETKLISDYVTLTPSTTDASVVVNVKKNFPTQMVLKCTSVSNRQVTATCSIDCYKRLTSLYIDASNTRFDNMNELAELDVNTETKIVDVCGNNIYTLDDYGIDLNGAMAYTNFGTTNVNVECKLYINVSTNLNTHLNPFLTSTPTRYEIGTESMISIFDVFDLVKPGFKDSYNSNLSRLILALKKTDHWFDLTVEYVSKNASGEVIESESVVYKMIGFTVSYYTTVTTISLDKTAIVI